MSSNNHQDLLWAGEFGIYQWIQYTFLLLPIYTAGLQTLSQTMIGATPKHKCLMNINNDTIDSCNYFSDELNETLSCQSWEFDQSEFGSTIISQWNLVCDRRWMGAILQSIFMSSSLISSTVLGQLADRYGRRRILIPTGILQMIFAILCGFVDNYFFYILLRCVVGITVAGAATSSFVLILEMVPHKDRTRAGFFAAIVFALGIAGVAGWSYFIRDWHWLEITFGLNSSVLLLHYWFVDESPRWLFTQGRVQEANEIVCKQLVRNGKANLIPNEGFSKEDLRASLGSEAATMITSTDPEDDNKSDESVKQEQYGIIHLFKTPRLRLRTLNISLNWFANSLVYYGLSLNTDALVGEPHLMLFLSGIIEIPAYILSVGIIDKVGRRPVISFCLLGGGLVCIAAVFFPQSSFAWTTSTTCIVMLGKAFISISFTILFNYTVELFPTVVRSSAMGLGHMCDSIAGTFTPLIFLLDSTDPKLPSVLFGITALAAGIFSLFLPETKDSPLLNTLEEGEDFGRGDTAFAGYRLRKRLPAKNNNEAEGEDAELAQPLRMRPSSQSGQKLH